MDNDDEGIGRVFRRRKALALFGAAALSLVGGARAAGVMASPEQTEGPFFVDERLRRSDIRRDPATGALCAGTPLTLALQVYSLDAGRRRPLPHAVVDVWHCDANGHYSDAEDDGTGGHKFLRGYQVTDAKGRVHFTTVYPGWYDGRTVHIHFKVRRAAVLASAPEVRHHHGFPPGGMHHAPPPGDHGPGSQHRVHEFTSQLYFDDRFTDRLHASAPYNTRGQRQMRNTDDGIYRDGGKQLILHPVADGNGYRASFEFGLVGV